MLEQINGPQDIKAMSRKELEVLAAEIRQFLIEKIEKYYDYYSPISQNKGKIGLALLGNDAGIYGAARLVLG